MLVGWGGGHAVMIDIEGFFGLMFIYLDLNIEGAIFENYLFEGSEVFIGLCTLTLICQYLNIILTSYSLKIKK